MRKHWFVIGLLTLCLPFGVKAQLSNLRTKTIDIRRPVQTLDTLTLLPSLFFAADSASGQPIPFQFFRFQNNLLLTDTAAVARVCPQCTRAQITYRVLPLDLGKPVFRLDSTLIRRSGRDNDISFDYSPYEAPAGAGLLTNPGLSSTGAYTRGLSLGNSQNLVFNSNLNLQLEGKFGNDLNVRAALSDNSVPLQPDGSTQRLQEFDRVYIELEKKGTTLAAGDLDFTRPGGYFSNYFKRVQGAKLSILPVKKQPGGWAGVGVSKGKFNRQIIQGQEGNQGPYRLQGAEGERFIIVLAGTEKVYADGKLLQRGQTDDYVIDYNLGELAFTQKRLITKDIRIIVEFEYAVQNYLRSTVAAHTEWNLPKGKFWFNFYSEQDGLNATGNLDLSPTERSRLAQVGDSLSNAYASGIDTLETFEASRVLYQPVDTVVCGVGVSILVYSTDPAKALYAARFTEVLPGQGNYIQAPNSANGRVYKWVAPDPNTCQPQGNFEPIVKLIAPEQRQLHTLGGEYQLSKKTKLYAEASLSQRDLNRFSPLGNNDNLGAGIVANLQHQTAKRKGWSAQADADLEWISETFRPLNPYRPAEFTRDWNVSTANTVNAAERLLKAGISLNKEHWGTARYELNQFSRTVQYDGLKQTGRVKFQRKGWELIGEVNELTTQTVSEKTRFSRPKFDLSHSFLTKDKKPLLKTGLYTERERNRRRDTATDTLNRTGFWYDLARAYVSMPQREKAFQAGGSFSQRNDYVPLANGFLQSTTANDLNINGSMPKGAGALDWNFTWRKLRINNPELTKLDPQNTYLGRLDYRYSAFKNGLNFTTGYEIGSGQTPKVEYNYLLVNPGEGQYSWVDRNRDSILQVDEMEIAVFQDQAAYIRVAVTTPEYLRTNNVVFNQNFRLEPRLWMAANPKGIRKIWNKIALQSTLQINRRTLAGALGVSPWNPFELNVADSALVTVSSSMRQVLFVNRADPRWDASLSWGDNKSRILATTGFESRNLSDQILHGRLNLSRKWSTETDLINSLRSNTTENFTARNYRIPGLEITPKITWMPVRNFRIVTKFSWKTRMNTLESAEKSSQTDWNAELSWNPQAKPRVGSTFNPATSIRASMKVADIQYTGQSNTPVAFAMLEGLQDGRNLLWTLTIDRQLSKSMQLNLSYEGRRTGGSDRVVHVGRAQVRAVF